MPRKSRGILVGNRSALNCDNCFCLFRNEGYPQRMAAMHKYLVANCTFKDSGSHAGDFGRLMFNSNYRSLHCWRKEDRSNKRKDMVYTAVESLPVVIRTWILEERLRHIPYFEHKWAYGKEGKRRKRPHTFNAVKWLRSFRKLFTVSTGEAFKKQRTVKQLVLFCNIMLQLPFAVV